MKKKNQKTTNLKKLALMGVTAGLMLQSQGLLAQENPLEKTDLSRYLASCAAFQPRQNWHNRSGGNHYTSQSCSSYSSCNGYYPSSDWESQTHDGSYYYPEHNGQAYSSCSAYYPQQNGYSQSSCGGYQPQQNLQAQSSCSAYYPQQNGYSQSSCGGYHPQQNWQAPHSSLADNVEPGQDSSMNGVKKNGYSDPYFNDETHTEGYYDSENKNGDSFKNGYESDGQKLQPLAEMKGVGKPAAKLNEKELLDHLNAQGKAAFQSLTPEGKALAIKMASQTCAGQNDCKGQNACATKKNECAGKGGCKGQSVSAFEDKNVAVKVAAAKMAEKRNAILNQSR